MTHQVEALPSDDKNLMELDILQASENLEKYQQETTKWRDKKVVKKSITVGDWVLKKSPMPKPPANFTPSGKDHFW